MVLTHSPPTGIFIPVENMFQHIFWGYVYLIACITQAHYTSLDICTYVLSLKPILSLPLLEHFKFKTRAELNG